MTGAVRFFHLVGAMVWVGGLITLGALIPALRKAGADRSMLQAVARQFARVSWVAFAVAVLTGGWAVIDYLDARALPWKLGLVAITGGLAAWHQLAARNQSARMRGILQGLILVSSLGVVAAAVAL
jgi:putative copper export protein